MSIDAPTESTVIDGEIIEVKTPAAALAVMNPAQYGRELMEPFVKQLTAARRRVGREKFDITTKDGMATAKQLRKLFVTIRTDADEAKSNAKRPIDAAGKAILAEFKPIEDGAKAEEKKIADVIAAEEARIEAEKQAKIAAERARIEAIEARLAHIRNIPNTLALAESAKISTTIDALLEKQLEPALYDEFLEDAASAMIETVEALRGHLQAALVREEAARVAEENALELARMKAEQAERDRVAAEERAERERLAKLERDQTAKREQDMREEMETMRKQMAAMLAAANPVVTTMDLAEPEPEPEPEPVAGFLPITDEQVEALGEQMAEVGIPQVHSFRTVLCDLNDEMEPEASPACPPLAELLDVLAEHYETTPAVVAGWLLGLNQFDLDQVA